MDDEKQAHLNNLENAADNLQLFKADLLDYNSLCAAIAGCSGVLHVASPCTTPVSDPKVERIEPAVKGPLNVLKACTEAKVKRVVVVPSRAAAIWNRNWPIDQPIDEELEKQAAEGRIMKDKPPQLRQSPRLLELQKQRDAQLQVRRVIGKDKRNAGF
ncbi:hypothetical protein C5167_038854 [Papaver somniferum]|uniref:3-beta hydroxysteroid dehydrogenase/isomerase domain-containing protein n=1 Tax=Papaver somniferum TaxID=3469 RepID=A0A4Y7IAP6_PAPSO|nr:hypothetical protein C5167_038854 [Papaver somniferum]